MNYDYLVIAGYFCLIISIGFIFKKMAAQSTSDYFRGGGKMLWWMVGSTAFMAQFSAVTFTGAAGKAFTDGFGVCAIFFGNVFAFYCGYKYFAHRFRQMRVDTPSEAIGRRYGHGNELFFSWALILFSLMYAGVWLNALAVFTGAVFQTDINTATITIGLIVLFVSVISGSWGVVASDFVQTLVVAAVSVACAVVALVKVGGPIQMVDSFPGDFFIGPNMSYPIILIGTFIAFLPKQTISIMNMHESFRYLTAKDSINARKACLLALVLMGVGSIIWFIPAWSAASLYPDAAVAYAALGSKAADAVYLEFARNAMPVGTVGLLMAGLFAATMSSMDSALNKNAGIFVRSIYEPFLVKRNKPASDTKLLFMGKAVSLLSGSIVIGMALLFAAMKGLSIFELMISVSVMVQMPMMIPLIFGLLLKKTPSWAPWVTVFVGLLVSWFIMNIFTANVVAGLFGVDALTKREAGDLNIILMIVAHIVLTGGFFWATSLFYREFKDANRAETDRFFDDFETPVTSDGEYSDVDRQQRYKLGLMAMVMSLGVVLLALIPNPLWGRTMFVLCALAIFIIGYLLKHSTKSNPTGATCTQSA